MARAVDEYQVNLAGDRTVVVALQGKRARGISLEIPGPDVLSVAAEKIERLPDFNASAAGWQKGFVLSGVRAEECAVKGALDPDSLIIREGPDPAAVTYVKGKDYDADLEWGTVGRLPGGKIKADQPVFVSYTYSKMRIDSIVLTAGHKIMLRQGDPHVATPTVPMLGVGETRLANLFLYGRPAPLTSESLYPILETAYPEPPKTGPSIAESLLPKTLQKLRSGETIKILAWGDSVTTFERWQKMFVERLKAKYPKAKIELVTEAWGGRNTDTYLGEPPGSPHNYQEKVLNQKPDLIVSEFVNDAWRNEAQVQERYSKLLGDFQAIGAEWIVLSPHYIRPDWMGLTTQRNIDDDPRPYVKGLRLFAAKHNVALADASLRYGRLWRQGIPYLTLMDNNINHPNVYGHTLFADSLIALFP